MYGQRRLQGVYLVKHLTSVFLVVKIGVQPDEDELGFSTPVFVYTGMRALRASVLRICRYTEL